MFPHFSAHTAIVRGPVHSAWPAPPAGRGPLIRHTIASASRLAVCSVAMACGLALAQTPPPHLHPAPPAAHSPEKPRASSNIWSEANDTVGQFRRGHIDLLRWEQNHRPPTVAEDPTSTNTAPLSLPQALHMALHNQPRWWGREGMSAAERARLNTAYQARVLQVRRAWIEAVTAQQSAQYSRQILQAAEAGAELAERMARIGNWSRARQMQEELLLWDAHTRVQNADLQALHSALALWQLTGDPQPGAADTGQQTPPAPHTSGPSHTPGKPGTPGRQQALPSGWHLPPLPDLPQPERRDLATLEARALAAHQPGSAAQADAQRLLTGQHASSLAQARLALAQNSPAPDSAGEASYLKPPQLSDRTPWSHSAEAALQAQADADAWQRQIRADVRVAHAALHSALTHAAQSRQEVLRLHTALEQETLLRYNGMLSSTWELLASARQRIQSVDAAHQAQRQAWLAWADLQAVIGGLPYTGQPGTSTSPSTPQPAGH